jgi:hypothetical protein
MRAGGDKRGSSADRRARRRWLVSPAAGIAKDGEFIAFGGNGHEVPCYWGCGRIVDETTVEADRLVPGSSYRRGMIVPACRPCNLARSDDGDLTPGEIAARVAATVARTGRLTPALVG